MLIVYTVHCWHFSWISEEFQANCIRIICLAREFACNLHVKCMKFIDILNPFQASFRHVSAKCQMLKLRMSRKFICNFQL